MTDDDSGGWEGAYASDDPVGWDTGDPQPVVETLAAADAFTSPVLDVGCGLGTESCFLASEGYDVLGVDVAPTAVERARDRAAERGLDDRVAFAVGDALELGTTEGVLREYEAASVLDVGVFHALPGPDSDHDDRRDAYADSLARVLEPGGRAFVLSFGPDAPADWPPDRISRADVAAAFDVDETDSGEETDGDDTDGDESDVADSDGDESDVADSDGDETEVDDTDGDVTDGEAPDGEGLDGPWRAVAFRDETYVSRGGDVPALLAVLERTE